MPHHLSSAGPLWDVAKKPLVGQSVGIPPVRVRSATSAGDAHSRHPSAQVGRRQPVPMGLVEVLPALAAKAGKTDRERPAATGGDLGPVLQVDEALPRQSAQPTGLQPPTQRSSSGPAHSYAPPQPPHAWPEL